MKYGKVAQIFLQEVALSLAPIRVQRALAHLCQGHNSKPRMILTYSGAKLGCRLKTKLATSVSTTSLAVAFGGDVSTALLIDEADEGFGFFRGSRIDVAQQPFQAKRAGPDQVGRIFDGLWWYTVHVVYFNASATCRQGQELSNTR